MIETIHGPMDETLLITDVIEESIPCGSSITTRYLYNGGVVRQDVIIKVSAEALTSKVGPVH